MNRGNRSAAVAVALTLVSATAVCNGVWTGRWQADRDISPIVAQLDRIPMHMGDWQGKAARLDTKEIAQAEASGSWMRTYEHASTGEIVTVLLIVGRPGPVSVHSPDVCYPASGYEADGDATRRRLTAHDGSVAEFWKADFRKESTPIPGRLRIYWAWRGRDGWSAPFSPRVVFAREDLLYKLYVVRALFPGESDENDASAQFIETFLNEFNYGNAQSEKY